MGINKVMLLGNLGADPELRYTQSQMPVCTFNLATGERRKNAEGEWVDHTEWHSVVVWGKQAENCNQYLAKGRQAFIEGRIQTKKWQDAEGVTKYKTEIVASNVQFIGGNRGETTGIEKTYSSASKDSATPTPGAFAPSNEPVSFDDDDIPF